MEANVKSLCQLLSDMNVGEATAAIEVVLCWDVEELLNRDWNELSREEVEERVNDANRSVVEALREVITGAKTPLSLDEHDKYLVI